jgi:RND family efflux transporter MFP subunit
MKSFFIKNRIVVAIIVVVLGAGGIYMYVNSSKTPTFDQNTVSKGNIVESVDESGSVLAENSAAVSFQQGGQIAHVYVKEGSMVAAGTILADLDASQLNAAARQADAALAGAQAQYDSLAVGTRPEQLQINKSAVTSADQALGIAVQNSYSASDDAVHNQLDNLFTNTKTNNPIFIVPSNDSQAVNDITTQRLVINAALAQWFGVLNVSSTVDPASLSGMAITNLQQIKTYIDKIALIVNGAAPSSNMPAATLAQYKVNVATARAEVQASISVISGDSTALTAAQNQLTLAQAGATPQALEGQKASVMAAQAAVASAQVALGRSSLIAPFSGTVQNLTAQVGEVVSPGTPLMSLINNSGLKIQTYVSEADVAKLKNGNAASVTLDAFGTGTNFPAIVSTIDAAETQVSGSAAYMVTLHFVNSDARIKDGMTGNVHIIVAKHDNVIEVPSTLVINDNNNHFVLAQNGTTIEKKAVQIGLVGNNGMTEITSGLNVGDRINNF